MFLIIQEMELSNSKIKTIIILYPKKTFLIFPENGTLHFLSPGSNNRKDPL